MTDPIAVHEWGEPTRPTLILLHGLTDAGTTWPDAVERWSKDWHIVAADLRGHGSSPRFLPAQYPHCMDLMVADAVALVERWRPALVVGHSLGGRVAILTALQRPGNVAALVLEDPATHDSGPSSPQFVAHQQHFLATFSDGGASERSRMRRQSTWSEAEIDAWAACKAQVDAGMIAHLDLGQLDGDSAFAALQVPTLVVTPVGSALIPDPATVTNPLVRIEQLAGTDHCVRRTTPAAYHALVDPFLTQHRPGARL